MSTSLAQIDQQGESAPLEVAYLSRQPIYRQEMSVYGYELLYRNGNCDSANFIDGDQATAQVIHNAIEFGLDKVIGREELAFVNLTRKFILEDYCYSLPKDRVVLEVLEDISAEDEIITKLQALSDAGYLIALDDFVYDESLRPLVELADIIKVDVMACGIDRIEEEIRPYKDFKLLLLAEKVETQDEFEVCKELGFTYFQGYFLSKPKLMEGRQIPTNRIAATQLVAKLQNPNIKPAELEATIRQDVTLSYKLLRFVNSMYCSLPRKVDSIGHAAMMIGTERIRNWASLLMLASMDDKPRELMLTAIIRAKMCEVLADKVGLRLPERLFTVGLLSVLDAMLDSTMEDVLERLPLSEEVAKALLTKEDTLGKVLDFAISYEQDSWDNLSELAGDLKIDMPMAREAYLTALDWTTEITSELRI
jgi:EAL and modified HD-GYP domain-containing signal transduction protein